MLQVTTVALLLTLFIQYIEGFERVIEISESNDHDELSSDIIVTSAIGSGSGSYILENLCCIYGNCTCPSLYNALVNLSSNVLINITTDVKLSSIIPLVDLANITITGHNNPTVNCNDFGGLHFISCYNCTIEGIIWESCGDRNINNDGNVYPVLQLFNSSDTIFKNCSFQHSIGQAIVLSEMSGGVNINYCNFSFNKQFEGHGTAIHYSSNNIQESSPFKIMITNCNFFYNGNAKSVVYFGQSSHKLCEYLILQNSKFHYNRGTPVYLTNQNLYMNGKIEFYGNVAENGGGIFISNHSNVTFHKSATVNFTQNTANNNGGAIFLTNHSSILFKDHPTSLYQCHELHNTIGDHYLDGISLTVTFFNNTVNEFGAYIYAHSSNITIGDTATVKFKGDQLYNRHNGFLYIEHYSAIIFEGNSIGMFYNGGAVYSVLSAVTFKGNCKVTFYHNSAANGGIMNFGDHSDITFEGNSTVTFVYNRAFQNGSRVVNCLLSAVTFKGNSKVTFFYNRAYEGAGIMYIGDHSNITFEGNSTVTFDDNIAIRNGSRVVYCLLSAVTFKGNSKVTFFYNRAYEGAGIMYIGDHSNITFEGNSTVTFDDNIAIRNGSRVVYCLLSAVTFKGNSALTFYHNIILESGTMYIGDHSNITLEGNSIVTFDDNVAAYNGSGVYCVLSVVTFKGNSTLTFYNNRAHGGGTMYVGDHSNIIFEENTTVTFDENEAYNGGAVNSVLSAVTFKGNSAVTFHNNTAYDGGTMYIDDHSNITFEGYSTVTFDVNEATQNGGDMYSVLSAINFKEKCKVTFHNNVAYIGGTMYVDEHSIITFEGNSTVTFDDNEAYNGGAVYSVLSAVTFKGNCKLMFLNNIANNNGGTMYIDDQSNIKFEGNSTVTFNDNEAYRGGTMYIDDHSNITFAGISTVTFDDNEAYNGGAVDSVSSAINFKGNCKVMFHNNVANNNGGTVYIDDQSNIKFEGNSTATFDYNAAYRGGTMYIGDHSNITFAGNSSVTFDDNKATHNGGAFYSVLSVVNFKGNCKVTFHNNVANNDGGTMYIDDHSNITFEGNSTVAFDVNEVVNNGGAVYSVLSRIIFNGNSSVKFEENEAITNGGAMYVTNSIMTFQGNSTVTFYNNTANTNGGAYYVHDSVVISKDFSSITFNENTALQDGGAIYLSLSVSSYFHHVDKSNITFYDNSAGYYGGAVYIHLKTFLGDAPVQIFAHIYLNNNTALTVPSAVYLYAPNECDNSCLMHYIGAITNNSGINHTNIATNPNKLILYNSAICINGSDTNCDTYYMNNVMLGQEITFDACVVDYFDQQTEATQFVITGMNVEDYKILGTLHVTISCNRTTQGISITGNLHSNSSFNYSIIISSHVTDLESKILSVKLTIELSQCHPGFWYSSESQKCECYSTNNIISCSRNSSTIKRGYWFGTVTGKPTVAFCPNDYCNFTCCEITNSIYHLSPVRAKQCRPHRCDAACGNCEKGYTLSFDSPQCIDKNKCSIGQTILVTILSLLYWIAVVVTVFTLTYFKVTVGSLYAIIYYYSVIDILLNPVLFISNGLYTTINIMSSLTKLTPQFLGQLCLVRDMSGIDQQFIHYAHPAAVLFILIMISILARRSSKVSSFVSRGIIPFICFLLLLSYTSMATTSLLLMRPLTFVDVDKVYTYLSPDIQYLHGRHIAYIIPAIIFTIVIVISFPLLLLLEPFLNSKINFIKIKPLLDQFQGCYKDKYRCFAGYYMICRLVIILLVIVKISDDFTTRYLLISSCALMELIHILVRPYANTIHNILDGILLQLIVIISVLPIVEIVDNYDETFVVVNAYLLVILPLTSFIAVKFWINKNNIQKSFKNLIDISKHIKGNEVATNDTQQPVKMREFETVVDDESRRNATVVDV